MYLNNSELSHELLYSLITSPSEYGIIMTDRHNKVLLWNKGAEAIYGYSSDEMLDKRLPYSIHKKDRNKKDYLFSKRYLRRNIRDAYVLVNNKTGTKIPVSITVSQRHNSDNKLVGYLYIVRDVTKFRLQEKFRDLLIDISRISNNSDNVEQMCQQMIEKISEFLDIKTIFICIFDYLNNRFNINSQVGLKEGFSFHHCDYCSQDCSIPSGKLSCHKTYMGMGVNTSPLKEHSISDYVNLSQSERDQCTLIHIPLVSDVSLIGILHLVVPNNQKGLFLTETQILNIISNEITGGIRRRKLLEEIQQYADNLEKMVKIRTEQLREKDAQLIQSGKLATLGELATGIAHEINQPLGAISLMSQGLIMAKKREKLDDNILMDKLNDITKQVDRINKIITHLRTFARQTENIKEPLDIRRPLLDVFKIIGQQLINSQVDVTIDINEELPLIMAEHTRIEQVFLNLINNAKDAIDELENKINEQYHLKSQQSQKPKFDRKISVKAYTNENHLVIEISDNGIGISEINKEKIFDPFFTTKEVGKGTGLGLSITYGIVRDYGGTIEINSEEMLGSTFIIKFPIIKSINSQEE